MTATELRSQREIVRVIRQAYRNDLIIGEEDTEGEDGAELRWYIDPLDGTGNYAHGLPFYCVYPEEIALGAVYDPLREAQAAGRYLDCQSASKIGSDAILRIASARGKRLSA